MSNMLSNVHFSSGLMFLAPVSILRTVHIKTSTISLLMSMEQKGEKESKHILDKIHNTFTSVSQHHMRKHGKKTPDNNRGWPV